MNDARVWDKTLAKRLLGSTVLIGLTYRRPEGDEQVQLWGVVTCADRKKGVCVTLSGIREGEDYWLPPQTDVYVPAQPGVYVLNSTGEEVTDPDFTTSWTITPPAN